MDSIIQKREDINTAYLVRFSVWFYEDPNNGHQYNHEYIVTNELTGQTQSFDLRSNGWNFKKIAEDFFNAECKRNISIIDKVKKYLGREIK